MRSRHRLQQPGSSNSNRGTAEQQLLSCADRGEMVKVLRERFREVPRAIGLANRIVAGDALPQAALDVARAIREAKVLAFEDLGMEAIYEFTVEDMPVTVAVDSEGNNVHQLAPRVWREKIAKEGLLQGA